MSVLSPELASRVETFADLCPLASSQNPHLPHSPSRSVVSRVSSQSLRCSTSSVNQQISSELRSHLSFFPPSVQHLSFLTVSIIFPSSSPPLPPSLPPSHCWVRSAGRKSSYVFTFCRDTRTPISLRARVQNVTAGSTRTLNLTSNAAP